jgi:hypothetical protein
MNQTPNLLPLVVGVTGHRDLPDAALPDIEKAVAEVFVRLKRDYLNGSNATPTIVLSALAEGADQIVARIALQHGARLIAPLPLPVDEYRRDFEKKPIKPDAAATFDEWLNRDGISKLVIPFTPGNSLTEVNEDPAKRNEQYRAVGLFIVRHCNVLIALWDGNEEMAIGGTSEIVKFKRRGIPPAVTGSGRASMDAPEIGPVIHIVTPRAKTAATTDSVTVQPWGKDLERQYPELLRATNDPVNTEPDKQQKTKYDAAIQYDLKLWTSFRSIVELTQQFNREAEKLRSLERRVRVANSLALLFANGNGQPDAAARASALEIAPGWCESYAVADALAQKWQAKFRRGWLWLFALALAAIGFFELFAHFAPVVGYFAGEHWQHIVDTQLLGGYILAFMAIFIIFFFARMRQLQERFLDYRALAEALRIAVFWKLNGIGPIADAYPIKLPKELAWVKTCLLARELLDAADDPKVTPTDVRIYSWTRNIWVGGQASYFSRRSAKYLQTAERREKSSLRILKGAILLACTLFGFKQLCPECIVEWQHHLFLLFLGVLPALAAVPVGYVEQLAFKAQARQYDRMRQLFERALELLPETPVELDSNLAQDIFYALGKEAMSENAEWVAIYRQRPIRPPQG